MPETHVLPFFGGDIIDTYHIYILYMIMITSKGQLPGDFGRFYYKKKQAKNVSVFQRKYLQNPTTLWRQRYKLIDDPNRLARIVVGWDSGMGFLGTKICWVEF